MKDIMTILQDYDIEVHREGSVLRAFCPFHSDTRKPNFTVYPETDSWFCFACSEGGNGAAFIAKIEGITYREAISRLKGFGVDVEELREEAAGLLVPNDPLVLNEKLNIVVSGLCRDVMYRDPTSVPGVMTFLERFDEALKHPIYAEESQKILAEVSALGAKVNSGIKS